MRSYTRRTRQATLFRYNRTSAVGLRVLFARPPVRCVVGSALAAPYLRTVLRPRFELLALPLGTQRLEDHFPGHALEYRVLVAYHRHAMPDAKTAIAFRINESN